MLHTSFHTTSSSAGGRAGRAGSGLVCEDVSVFRLPVSCRYANEEGVRGGGGGFGGGAGDHGFDVN